MCVVEFLRRIYKPANYLITSLPPYKSTSNYAFLREVWAHILSLLNLIADFWSVSGELVRRPLKHLNNTFSEVFPPHSRFSPPLHLFWQIVTNISLFHAHFHIVVTHTGKIEGTGRSSGFPGLNARTEADLSSIHKQVSRVARHRHSDNPTLATGVRRIFFGFFSRWFMELRTEANLSSSRWVRDGAARLWVATPAAFR